MPGKYNLRFDIWGLLLFLGIMVPNFIWFAVPAPNDLLRTDSVTRIIDAIGSVFQVLMVIALCAYQNREWKTPGFSFLIAAVLICCLLYFTSWIMYYRGMVNPVVLLGLTVPPCLAFMCFALYRKNMLALISATVFFICHLTHTIVNFIV
ncbi:MAG: hypothetical protein HFH80_07985 [Lachnospiraceae bacterium]|nr:hypothetical protein [Lachnospiraceae bacterium]